MRLISKAVALSLGVGAGLPLGKDLSFRVGDLGDFAPDIAGPFRLKKFGAGNNCKVLLKQYA